MTEPLLWYAAYGSNLHLARLTAYLAGGRPPGGAHEHPGCRDPGPPRDIRAIQLPGRVHFALESLQWTGGMAFYDPLDPGPTPARAYLITAEQFADLAAQEMRRPPGTDLDLREALAHGRAALGPGRYETLVHPGTLQGRPLLTFTAPWRTAEAPLAPPSAAYLRHLAAGLRESHAWDTPRIATYLATRPGAAGHWTPEALAELLT
ncbi:histone deacetylase [Kitasatospora sp. NBC_01287]|uniref:histone deacetylase n=1 Tax=Kitasatospora sp. NBC_01287 TaxID=2903573 RepID=UPI00225565F5|nr:histone deacetylase [Kitasatospora sp. NBC_01287]MCX4747317.1 histone deacetylase [Kitasatospora sp. NBC_01287]